jgi:hypothetical protein
LLQLPYPDLQKVQKNAVKNTLRKSCARI